MSNQYFSISNWHEFQHYKDRNPPWIKLHNQLLDNYEFECLTDATKGHLLCIWMLASRTNNKIIYDPSWVKRKIGANSPIDLKSMLNAGFIKLQDMGQDASNMLVSVEESREEKRRSISRFKPPTLKEVSEYCFSKNSSVDPEKFFNHYEANGWMRGKNSIKNWEACVKTWASNDKKEAGKWGTAI